MLHLPPLEGRRAQVPSYSPISRSPSPTFFHLKGRGAGHSSQAEPGMVQVALIKVCSVESFLSLECVLLKLQQNGG